MLMDLRTDGFYYLASPYTHPMAAIREFRYYQAIRAVAYLCARGHTTISPIVQCHEMAKLHILPTDFKFWKSWNERLIRASAGMIILKLDGWADSAGIADEIEFCKENLIPIHEMAELDSRI